MLLTFDEIGVNLADYNGVEIALVNVSIINCAADYVKDMLGGSQYDCDGDYFKHYDWGVDLVQRLIYIPETALVNSIYFYQ